MGKNGELKNLSAVGGSSDEYFSDGLLFENYLYLTGEFEETFSYGSKSESSKGAKDGFVMQLPLVDPSIVNWFLGFGGSENEKVNSICVSPIGKLIWAVLFPQVQLLELRALIPWDCRIVLSQR